MKELLQIRISSQLKKDLKLKAIKENETLSGIVTRSIIEYLAKGENK